MITIAIRLRYDYDPTTTWYRLAYITTAIRLRYHNDTTIPRRIRLRRKWSKSRYAFDSTAIRLRYDYDVSRAPASIRRDSTRAKMNMSIFCRSRIVVNRNCDIGFIRRDTPREAMRKLYHILIRKPSWRKGKRATAVRVWRPLAKKSTANFQLTVNSSRSRITYGLRIARYFRV